MQLNVAAENQEQTRQR